MSRTSSRRFSADLPQGGLEVPCSLTFIDVSKEVQKVKRLTDAASDVDLTTEPPNEK